MAGIYHVVSDFHHSELKASDEGIINEDEVCQITPTIYIANHKNAVNPAVLRSYSIGAILHLGDKVKTAAQLQIYKEMGIVHKTIVIEDKLLECLNLHFNDIWAFLFANSAKKIIVHCSNGFCRAPAAVLYFLVRKALISKPSKPIADKLYSQIAKMRRGIVINPDFLDQIRKYEADSMGLIYTPTARLSGREFLRADGGDEVLREVKAESKQVVVIPSE